MTLNILSQHKEIIAKNQAILDKFIEDNPDIKKVVSRKLIHGIGINDSSYVAQPIINGNRATCIFYRTWNSMMQRCYSNEFQEKRSTYIGCTVTDEWYSFMAFKTWMEKQGYKGKELDKDLLFIGNKIYSPDTCIFVSCKVNSLMTNCAAAIGDLPLGVSIKQGGYRAQININGKRKHLGLFSTIMEAETAYIKAKSSNIIKVALEQTSDKLMKALIMQASYMRVNFECASK